jgi:hypothetical protein
MPTSPWIRMQIHMSGNGVGLQMKTKRSAEVTVRIIDIYWG